MYWIKNTLILIFLFLLAFFVYKFNNINFLHNSINKKNINNINFEKDDNCFNSDNTICIKTDTFNISIEKNTGNIIKADLLKYKENINSYDPLHLLRSKKNFIYQVNSGLSGIDNNNFYYDNSYNKKKEFHLLNNDKFLLVPMKWISKNGISYIKTFIFERGKYFVKIKYDIFNNSKNKINLSIYGNLTQSINYDKEHHSYSFGIKTFKGAAYSSSKSKYEKINFNDIVKKNYVSDFSNNKWIAMIQPYFVSAWIPDNFIKNKIFLDRVNYRDVLIGYQTEPFNINSYENKQICSKLWIGPKIKKEMLEISDSLYYTIDYGFLWFLSQPLFEFLSYLNNIFNNWGVSIIAITCIIKFIMYPISKIQYVEVEKMKKIQKKISFLKKKYKDNKNFLSKEIMNLYKENNINPIGSFLPVIIQMPIFLSLYYVIVESVELRHSPFIFWIKDLSDKDPFFILPILMGITTFFMQNDSESDSSLDTFQQKIMHIMPIFFTIFFLWFPSGLVLYYIISNILTIVQQKIIYKKFKF